MRSCRAERRGLVRLQLVADAPTSASTAEASSPLPLQHADLLGKRVAPGLQVPVRDWSLRRSSSSVLNSASGNSKPRRSGRRRLPEVLAEEWISSMGPFYRAPRDCTASRAFSTFAVGDIPPTVRRSCRRPHDECALGEIVIDVAAGVSFISRARTASRKGRTPGDPAIGVGGHRELAVAVFRVRRELVLRAMLSSDTR